MSSIDEILAGYKGIQAGQEAFYKDLHEHPELSHYEDRTAQRVAGQLQEYGFKVQTGIGGTGVVGVLSNGAGPTVLLRAELDALPIREDTGVDYASTATAKAADGHEVPVDHACGHDMHMACLLGMAKLVASFPFLDNDPATTDRVAAAFAAHFGDNALELPRQTVSEDFGIIPDAAGIPYTYWGIGRTDRQAYLTAEKAGRLQDLPTNHSPKFLPPLHPTLRTGTETLVTAALAWLAKLCRTDLAPADLSLHAAARDERLKPPERISYRAAGSYACVGATI